MKKWSLILLLWYIFVDNTPWIQQADKKTVWILKPGWSSEIKCWKWKTIFEEWNGRFVISGKQRTWIMGNRKYMCIDMDYDNPSSGLNMQDVIDYFRKEQK